MAEAGREHIPFKGNVKGIIPRFPSFEHEVNGVIVQEPAEPRAAEMPTAEDSFFQDPLIARTADLVGRYMSPAFVKSHAAIENEIVDFCSNPERHLRFSDYVETLLGGIEHLPEEVRNSTRIARYRNILEKLGKRFSLPEARLQEKRLRGVALPAEIEREIPQEVFDLVNNSLAAAYPSEFGKLIPRLDRSAIRVVSDVDFRSYIDAATNAVTHPLFKAHHAGREDVTDTTNKRGPLKEIEFAVMHYLPGKPIIFPISKLREYLDAFKDKPGLLKYAVLARLLMHENMHRGVKIAVLPITKEDFEQYVTIATMSFAIDRLYKNRGSSPEVRELHDAKLKAIYEYLETHGTFVEIEGMIVRLSSIDDTDGEVKILGMSGYDLNEGFVEYLTSPTIAELNKILRKSDPLLEGDPLEDPVATGTMGAGSFQIQNLLPTVPGLLDKLGIKNRVAALRAYANGDIPRLYAQRFPKVEYYA